MIEKCSIGKMSNSLQNISLIILILILIIVILFYIRNSSLKHNELIEKYTTTGFLNRTPDISHRGSLTATNNTSMFPSQGTVVTLRTCQVNFNNDGTSKYEYQDEWKEILRVNGEANDIPVKTIGFDNTTNVDAFGHNFSERSRCFKELDQTNTETYKYKYLDNNLIQYDRNNYVSLTSNINGADVTKKYMEMKFNILGSSYENLFNNTSNSICSLNYSTSLSGTDLGNVKLYRLKLTTDNKIENIEKININPTNNHIFTNVADIDLNSLLTTTNTSSYVYENGKFIFRVISNVTGGTAGGVNNINVNIYNFDRELFCNKDQEGVTYNNIKSYKIFSNKQLDVNKLISASSANTDTNILDTIFPNANTTSYDKKTSVLSHIKEVLNTQIDSANSPALTAETTAQKNIEEAEQRRDSFVSSINTKSKFIYKILTETDATILRNLNRNNFITLDKLSYSSKNITDQENLIDSVSEPVFSQNDEDIYIDESFSDTTKPYTKQFLKDTVADAYYPRVPATNTTTWTDNGYTVTAKVSDAVLGTGYVYYLFNHIITSQDHYHSLPSYTATGNTYAGATRFKTFAGIAISIDFGRSIYPERMRIAPRPLQSGFTGNDFILGAPKAFKIFASDDASCWNDNNHSSWTQIHNQTTSLSYVNEQYTIVNFTSNLSKYRYYTMVVLSTIGNYAGGYMMFSEWNVGGDEKIVILRYKNEPIQIGNEKQIILKHNNNLLKYDFTPYNTESTWKAYAATVPNFTYSLDASFIIPYDPDAVWSGWYVVGWVQMTLPSTHNFFTITYGLGVAPGLAQDVRLLINGVLKSSATPSNKTVTYSQAYNVGDVVRIEETFSTMSANFIFQFTNISTQYRVKINRSTRVKINNTQSYTPLDNGIYDIVVGSSTSKIVNASNPSIVIGTYTNINENEMKFTYSINKTLNELNRETTVFGSTIPSIKNSTNYYSLGNKTINTIVKYKININRIHTIDNHVLRVYVQNGSGSFDEIVGDARIIEKISDETNVTIILTTYYITINKNISGNIFLTSEKQIFYVEESGRNEFNSFTESKFTTDINNMLINNDDLAELNIQFGVTEETKNKNTATGQLINLNDSTNPISISYNKSIINNDSKNSLNTLITTYNNVYSFDESNVSGQLQSIKNIHNFGNVLSPITTMIDEYISYELPTEKVPQTRNMSSFNIKNTATKYIYFIKI